MPRAASSLLVWLFVLTLLLAGGPVGVLYVCGPYWLARWMVSRP